MAGELDGIRGLFNPRQGNADLLGTQTPTDFQNQTNAITDNFGTQLNNLRGGIQGTGNQYLGDIFSMINGNMANTGAAANQALSDATVMGQRTNTALAAGQNALNGSAQASNMASGGLGALQNLYNNISTGNTASAGTQGEMRNLYNSGLATGGLGQLADFQAGGGSDADAIRAAAFGGAGMNAAGNAANGLAGFQGAGNGQAGLLQALGLAGTDQANTGLSLLGQMATQGSGPSAAEAMLRQQGGQAMADNIALARSGRGAGQNATAQRQALFQNAAQQQQLGDSMAALRANELATARGQNLTAAQSYASGAQGLLGLQGNLVNQSGQLAQGASGQDLSALTNYGQLGLGMSGQQTNALTNAGQLALGGSGQQLNADQALTSGSQGAANTQLGILNQLLGGQLNQEANAGNILNNYVGGSTNLEGQNTAAYAAANNLAGTMGNLGLGYNNLAQGYTNAGMQNEQAMMGQYGQSMLGLGSLLGNMDLGEWGQTQAGAQAGYGAQSQYEMANAQFANQMSIANSQLAQQQTAAQYALLGSMITGLLAA